MATKKSKKSSSTKKSKNRESVKLDMRKVEHGKKGGYRYPEQEYKVRIKSAKRETNQNSGNTQIILDMEIVEPEKFAGKPYRDYVTLTKKALWRVGQLMDAIGIKWSAEVMTLPLGKLEGKVLGVQLYDDDYGGKIKSKVSEYYSEEEVDEFLNGSDDEEDEDEDDDDDELDEDEEEDEDEEDEDEEDDDDEDEDDI